MHEPGWQVLYNRDEDIWCEVEEPVTPGSLYRFIDPILERVDVYLLDPGSRAQYYPTQVSEMFAADEARWQRIAADAPPAASSAYFERQKAHFLALVRAVGDPMAAVFQRCHEKGVSAGVSYRMNDTHYAQLQDHYHFTEFCVDHRAWRIPRDGWYGGGFDFAIDEVRGQAVELLREHCEHFDLDVLEMDFLRHPCFFRKEVARPDRLDMMSEVVGQVREHAAAAGRRRGRPIRVQARVPSTVSACETVGLDVRTWAREGWVDALVAAPPYSMEFDIPVEEFLALDPTGRMAVYAGLEKLISPEGYPGRHLGIQEVRGAIAKHARRGAAGVHFFNGFAWDPELEMAALDEARDPGRLAGKSKHYLLTLTSRLQPGATMQTPLPAEVPAGENAAPLHIDFRVPDDLRSHPPHAMQFSMQLRDMDPEQSANLRITVNGQALSGPGDWRPAYKPWMDHPRAYGRGPNAKARVGSRDHAYMDPWIEFQTPASLWRQDANDVAVKLGVPAEAQVILRGMELSVTY